MKSVLELTNAFERYVNSKDNQTPQKEALVVRRLRDM